MDFPEMMPRSPACPTRNVHSSFEKSGLFLSWNGMGHAAWGKAPNNTIKDVGSRQLWYIYPHLDHLVNSMVIKAVYTKSTPQTVQDKKNNSPKEFFRKKKNIFQPCPTRKFPVVSGPKKTNPSAMTETRVSQTLVVRQWSCSCCKGEPWKKNTYLLVG